MSLAKKDIKNVGLDITNTNVSKLPTKLDRVGFVIINTYQGTSISLGDGPMNDGYNMAKCLKKRYGYQVFYIINQKKQSFKDKFAHFLKCVENEFVLYYVGHGTSVRDTNGDESDGYDEALVFVDGNVIDDELIDLIIENKNETNKCVLVSDCCHSGTIWDIQGGNVNGRELPPNLLSISAANDKQTAKQTYVERMEQGMFTYNMNKVLKKEPNLSPLQLKQKMATSLRKYAQTVTIGTTTQELLNQPTF